MKNDLKILGHCLSLFLGFCLCWWTLRLAFRTWSRSSRNDQEAIFISIFHILHLSTAGLCFRCPKSKLVLKIIKITQYFFTLTYFIALGTKQFGWSHWCKKRWIRGCYYPTTWLDHDIIPRPNCYVGINWTISLAYSSCLLDSVP